MGTTREFFSSTLGDAVTPLLRRSIEDLIYETLDRRQVPNRGDLREVRAALEDLQRRLDAIEERMEEVQGNGGAPVASGPPTASPTASRTCKVPGCTDPFRSSGFCARHYQKWRRGVLPDFPYPA